MVHLLKSLTDLDLNSNLSPFNPTKIHLTELLRHETFCYQKIVNQVNNIVQCYITVKCCNVINGQKPKRKANTNTNKDTNTKQIQIQITNIKPKRLLHKIALLSQYNTQYSILVLKRLVILFLLLYIIVYSINSFRSVV